MTPKTGAQHADDQDIAVIGMSCRLPGAATPDEFWQLLRDGRDMVTRQDDGTHRAALDRHGDFDAAFFGMSAQEAAAADPQQRLMLELGWEALEDAGIVPATLSGTATGVFVGVASDDYATLARRRGTEPDAHTATGLHRAMTANRLSYLLGLRGPSIAVDTAQSSSIVAVHLACESLRRGETRVAVAGGVHLVLSPHSTATMDRMGALSPDGRCFTFDERANGYVRGEGGGAVILKPLRQALTDGDRVHCVIKGSAVNNDGGGPSLTTPHRHAQEAVLREAYERAGIAPGRVGYVELHGTGTKAGDPVEAAALGTVLGTTRAPDAPPLAVGSVKTNVGHLEGAAGIVGLLKAALCVREGELPPSLNHRRTNPDIPLDELGLRVQTEPARWEEAGALRVAGVSSFGMGGTNAHVVLEQAPPVAPAEEDGAPAHRLPVIPVVLSARSASGLREQAARLSARVEHDAGLALTDVGYSLAVGRSVFEHRAVVLAADTGELLTRLERSAVHGVASDAGRRVLVFPGQGTQWVGMGAGLLESSPVFARRLGECADALAPLVDFDVVEVVRGGGALDRVDVVQPVTWAVMVSLAAVWESLGVVPDAVVGHSQGEIAAAVVAGALSLEDGARVVALRAQVIGRVLAGLGGMASVSLPVGDVEERLAAWPGLGVAAVNGPKSTVVSGDADAVVEFVAACEAEGIRARQVPVDYASHSAHVERIEAELLDALAAVRPQPGRVPFYSTVTAGVLDTVALDASYWYRNLRLPVRFEETVRGLLAEGFGTFVESSAHPVLVMGVQETADASGTEVVTTGSLRRDEGGLERFLASAAEAFVHGVGVNWSVLFEGSGARQVDLPTYAFQRKHYWLDDTGPDELAEAGDETQGSILRGELRSLTSETEQREHLLRLVEVHAGAALGRDETESVSPDSSFKTQGFESITGVELRNRLCAATGLALPTTLVYDHPTPAAVAEFLQTALLADTAGPEQHAPTSRSRSLAPSDDDPVVIVGMACRFPGGVVSPEGLWDLVVSGGDAVSPFPSDRGWDVAGLFDPDPGRVGRSYVREGGFLHGAGEFDAEFFGISPREAVAMDPQQRLLLETSWEALERAGIDPHALRGSRTGVFAGAMSQEYGPRLHEPAQGYDGYLLTGNTASVISGRISYSLGLQGPALTVDTACSSSLVALHLAAQSLRRGECDLALAGGVAVMANPGMFVEFSRQRGLAPDGRSKAFADAADGTSWAEGAGMVLVERLSDAVRKGHRVLAVVRGSAVNQDGASNGLTAPSGPSQQRVIRAALADAGLGAAEVDAVEAHGTGTRLGDPIEAQALLATYGQGRSVERPLWLGSLKSNIGHAQAAAGVGGVIKMVMALRHGVLPQSLHIDEPSTALDWSSGAVSLLTEQVVWPEVGRPRRAGVSSFGISGTNAHVIVEQAPEVAAEAESAGRGLPVVPVVMSAVSAGALQGQRDRLRSLVEREEDLDLADVGYSLAVGRSVFEHRSVVLAGDRDELLTGLRQSASLAGPARHPGKRVLVFPGQGTQWVGMGAGLLESSPVFARRLRECADALAPFVDFDAVEVIRSGAALDRVDVVQPVTWAVMVSLAAVWESLGVVPDAVVGHSQGEIAAAVVAGALSLEDGARVVALRAQVIGRELAGLGGMASISLPLGDVEERLPVWPGLGVAAVNGPKSTVVSGDADAVVGFVAACEAEGIRARQVPVDYASHSAHVERIEAELLDALAAVRPQPGRVPFYSTVTAGVLDTTALDASYWYRNLRLPVRFEETVRTLLGKGFGTFVESSAHPVLVMGIQETADDASGAEVITTGSLRRDEGGLERFLASAAEAFVHGVDIDWTALYDGSGARQIDLPTYAFQRKHYWIEPSAGPAVAAAPSGVDTWRYGVTWKGLSPAESPALQGRWLLVVPEGSEPPFTHELDHALRQRGAQPETLAAPCDTSRSRFVELLVGKQKDGIAVPFAGVVSLLGLSPVQEAVGGSLSLLQAVHESGVAAGRVWAVTQQAVAVVPGEVPDDLGAQLWAFGRVAGLELPDVWGGLVDLPEKADARALDHLVSVLADANTDTDTEDQVAVRGSGVYARRINRAGGTAKSSWSPRGTVLVTGGTGALGGHVARWLVRGGADHVVLTSRRGADVPGAAALEAELREFGAEVTIAACDVSDRAALARLLGEHPPTAVFHTAGMLDDGLIDTLSPTAFDAIRGPKATAALHLHELTRSLELDAFVLFSSVTGTWGNGGQAAYASANASLDALAERRRAENLPATSIAWGLWGGGGMAVGAGEDSLNRRGIRAMDPDEGIASLQQALDRDDTCVTVIDVDWEEFAPRTAALRPTPMFDTVPEARRALDAARRQQTAARTTPVGELGRRLAGLTEAERLRTLVELVRGEAATVLRHDTTDRIRPDRPFKAAGFDSLTALELRNRLNAATGLSLPSTIVFDRPSPNALAEHLIGRLLDLDPAPAAPPVPAGGGSAAEPDEPLAIIGMACRYPGGADTPEALWKLVVEGLDVVGQPPTDRGWNLDDLYDADPDSGRRGTTYVREGGFLHEAGEFDAEFFGISPREAFVMDPQQRLLLETSWEALERAGIDPQTLRGSRTGVYAGLTHQEYASRLHEAPEEQEGYLLTGKSASVVSGRISYALGLEGPSVSVDTACSSSLVALHLAAQSLRQGECDLALAGGVTVMAAPGLFVEFSRQRGLAPDGRSKAFADAADGTSWAEGAGMVLVERLSDAVRNGHRVLAVVRGSAVNQDGASNGLTAPSGPSQQRVITQALVSARLTTSDVDVVEGHGTGTTLGDPIEAQALLATYGQGRSAEQPLWLGSLKSNIGHSQAAAGVGGVIKMVMALEHGVLPRTLHVDRPSSHVDWSSGAVSLLTEQVVWPEVGRPRRAAVSAFGVSGTNAHVIVEQAPEVAAEAEDGSGRGLPVVPVVLSGRSESALREQTARLAARVQGDPGLGLTDVGYSLAVGRSVFEHRAVVLAADTGELLTRLDRPAVHGVASDAGRCALVFPGQGTQWVGMGAGLLESSPVFARRLGECADALAPLVDFDAVEVIRSGAGLDRVDVVQPVTWAVMVSLAAVWESLGVVPDAVVGHSQGEIAAAVVCGALSLEDGARVVALRAQVIGRVLAGLGGMASISLPLKAVEERLAAWPGLGIAAVNGPQSTVVSGDADAVVGFVAACEAGGIRARQVPVDYASHSAHVERIEAELLDALAAVRPQPSKLPFYSTVTAGVLDTTQLNASYWYRNLRLPVRFEETVRSLLSEGFGTFIESSAHSALVMGIQETADDASGAEVITTGSLRRDEGGLERFLASAAEAFVHGVDIDWTALYDGSGARQIDLPTYAFQRKHYWAPTSPAGVGDAAAARFGMSWDDHPLIGGALPLAAGGELVFAGRISLTEHPWLADHAVSGRVLLPGTAFAELALHAAVVTGASGVEELGLEAPLIVPDRGGVRIQVRVEEAGEDGLRRLAVHSQPEDGDEEWGSGAPWTRHATAVLAGRRPAAEPSAAEWAGEAWPPAGAERIDVEEVYARFAGLGYEYGEVFAGLESVWRRDGEVFAEVALPARAEADASRYGAHPALLDAALQPWLAGGLLDVPDDGVLLPFAWQGLTLHAAGAHRIRVRMARSGDGAVSLHAVDPDGKPVVSLGALVMRPVERARLEALLGAAGTRPPLYRVAWQRDTAEPGPLRRTAVVGADPFGPDGLPGGAVETYLDLAALRAAVDAGAAVPEIVVAALRGRGAAGVQDKAVSPADVLAATCEGLALVQTWLADRRFAHARLVVLTEGAVAASSGSSGEDVTDLARSGLWGLVRSAQSEHPGRLSLVDTDAEDFSRTALPAAIAAGAAGADQLAVRAGTVLVPRLVRVEEHARDGEAVTVGTDGFEPGGTVLLTGATGTLGALLARHLVTAHGVRRLLLLSRSGRNAAGAEELEAELRLLGAEVEIRACDVADRPSLRSALDSVPKAHPLTAVIHAAGVLDDGAVDALDPGRVASVLRPKADAALHLHELTAHLPLRAFVLFSGAAGLLGRPGQANYAAANTFVDALAQHRRVRGLPTVSLAWGLWGEASGMTGHLSGADLRRMRRSGIAPLTNDEGLALFDGALRAMADDALLVPVRLDTAALRREQAAHGTAALPEVLRGLVPAAAPRAAGGTPGTTGGPAVSGGETSAAELAERVRRQDGPARVRELLGAVRTQVADVLGFSGPDAVEPGRAFREIGFDSLTAVDLRNRLNAATGLRLPAAVVFDHPTPEALAEHLDAQLAGADAGDVGEAALNGLAALESAVAAMAADDIRREVVHRRLAELLGVLGTADTAPPAVAAAPDAELAGRLDAADDEDLFAFIEEQL